MKSSQEVIESTAKLHSHFLARSLSVKGKKRNQTASSSNWCILIMRHTFSNSLMKKYTSLGFSPWNFGRVYELWFQFKTVDIGFRKSDGRWKGGPHGIEPLLHDVGWAITGSDFGWWTTSNQPRCVWVSRPHWHTQLLPQTNSPISQKEKEKFNHTYSKVDLDLDDS